MAALRIGSWTIDRRSTAARILFVGISLLPFLGFQLNGAWHMAVPLVLASPRAPGFAGSDSVE